jgi:predicted Zn-dependent protease
MALNGSYLFDDQGVRARRVEVVRRGILSDFLMSRTPIDKFPASNGHGRAQAGMQPVARQSNLIVETSNPLPMAELRRRLVGELKHQGKEYGYLFADVTGGFTMTGRFIPNAFNVTPTEVYRVFADGRPDEMVRGVDLVGTPLSVFSQIAAAGDRPEVFNGTCGAESGGVPVSAVSPALFVRQIEIQRKDKSQARPPLLPRPSVDLSPVPFPAGERDGQDGGKEAVR